ncbi:MAG: hypothetical protein J5524_02835 [Bacteroidaceae bacterium]|nr:hypothetical protein [Bacteroidaceae bacterium]
MEKTNENMNRLLEMLDNPSAYTEQEIHDIINTDDETRQAYRLMAAAKQGYRQKQIHQPEDVEAAWQRFEQKNYKQRRVLPRWMRVAAIFIAGVFLGGLSFAAYHSYSLKQHNQNKEYQEFADENMFELTEDGERIIITWLKKTWVETDNISFIEENPIVHSPALRISGEYKAHIKLNGKDVDINRLPNLPASEVKKIEIHLSQGRLVNIITTPVEIPESMYYGL